VARHYDELDPFYRALWGEHLHHGLWTTGRETPEEAALALVDDVARRAGIGPGDAVCDVGSGYGAVARRLTERGAHVTGLTVSEAQYRHAVAASAEMNGPDATPGEPGPQPGAGSASPRFLLRDWLANDLPDEVFDAVIAIESLSHMADPGRAVAEAWRALRPGGRFVTCAWLAAEDPAPWEVRWLLRPICDEGRLPGLPMASDYGRWLARAGFVEAGLDDVSHRVARTWTVVAGRVGGAVLRPDSWRYLLDGRNTERAFALSVVRLVAAYRTGAMRYGIVTGRKPG
jgi:tocopherol O-methyltransferase